MHEKHTQMSFNYNVKQKVFEVSFIFGLNDLRTILGTPLKV